MNKNIYLLLGSNLGDRIIILKRAHTEIVQHLGVIQKASAIYETAPWGKLDQPSFLNQVIHIQSDLSPFVLLEKCQSIETKLGRTRHVKWDARTIDIDILYINDSVINEENLIIPHPHLHKRNFTMAPLAEIASEFIHPVFKKNNYDLLKECEDLSKVTKVQV